jgi:hypothetical protein
VVFDRTIFIDKAHITDQLENIKNDPIKGGGII